MEDVRTKNKIRLIRSNSNLLWFLVIESSCREAWGFFVNLIKGGRSKKAKYKEKIKCRFLRHLICYISREQLYQVCQYPT